MQPVQGLAAMETEDVEACVTELERAAGTTALARLLEHVPTSRALREQPRRGFHLCHRHDSISLINCSKFLLAIIVRPHQSLSGVSIFLISLPSFLREIRGLLIASIARMNATTFAK